MKIFLVAKGCGNPKWKTSYKEKENYAPFLNHKLIW
jgi:hypothetical protein